MSKNDPKTPAEWAEYSRSWHAPLLEDCFALAVKQHDVVEEIPMCRMIWISTEMYELATKICGTLSSDLTVSIEDAGGDYDSDHVYIWYKKYDEDESDFVSICGFDTEHRPADRSGCSVEMIEMTSRHGDSGSGVVTDHEDLMLAAFRTGKALKEAGWHVVDDMDSYF